MDSLKKIQITDQKLINAIDEMPKNTSSGPDTWPAELVKKCKNQLCKPLKLIFERSLETGEIPDELLKAYITPIYKKGEKSNPINYRPISLTSLISKILERIIRKEIVQHLENNNLINESQHGFRKGRSCLSQLLDHYSKTLTALENGADYDVIYTDFSKAFDKCEFNIIFEKLLLHGIGGDIGRWIHNFLTNRTFNVVVNYDKSDSAKVLSSVPQGTVLAPILFIIMINDINENIESCDTSQFADDTKIAKAIKNIRDEEILQKGIDSMYKWSDKNNMMFNFEKFNHIRYSIKNPINSVEYKINNFNIKTVSEMKDLGIIMSMNMQFTTEFEKSTKKARQKMGLILRTFRSREKNLMLTLYKTLIRPHLEYGTVLTSPHMAKEIQLLEGIQRTLTSKITSIKHLNYWERLENLKLYSLERRRDRYAIIYIWKILENMVPNLTNDSIESYIHQRKGRLCRIPSVVSKSTARIKTIKRNSFTVRGPILFNTIPKKIRDLRNIKVDIFKNNLDKWLQIIPDKPTIPGYTKFRAENSNSIQDQLQNLKT